MRERLARLDRLQRTRLFKVISSIIVVAAAVGMLLAYVVQVNAPGARARAEVNESVLAAQTEGMDERSAEIQRSTVKEVVATFNDILDQKTDATGVAVLAGAALALLLAVIWLELALSMVGLIVLLGVVAGPMYYSGVPPLRSLALFLGAAAALSAAFVSLTQLLRGLLSRPGPVWAIARNVVNEAIRMKVSLIFIVMLIFLLAAMPGLLNENTPLRFRVQSFLQYATSGAYLMTACLCVFLAAGSVAFEQRDRVIWQTMTKPVRAWQYVLGKWLGVVGVGAVLLTVSAGGIFLFTEYLRHQKAVGEVEPFISRSGQMVTEDRMILATQVLSARSSTRPEFEDVDPKLAADLVRLRMNQQANQDPTFEKTAEAERETAAKLRLERYAEFLTVDRDESVEFTFSGLSEAKRAGRLLTLRYRIQSGSNNPTEIFRVSFQSGGWRTVETVPLDQTLTLPILPVLINENGELTIRVSNRDINNDDQANIRSLRFPPDGIELFYSVGSYRLNFVRVAFVLWMKIAFLSMAAVCAATFLSFPVASLLAFGLFLIAESAAFLSESLQYYQAIDSDRNTVPHRVVIRMIALPIAWVFRSYAELRPVSALVDGILMPWTKVMTAGAVLGLVTLALFSVSALVFRRRELAMYSGT